MIGYTLVGTTDLARARTFYDGLLGVIGATRVLEFDRATAWGTEPATPQFGVCTPYDERPATVGNGAMVALRQQDRATVDRLYDTALALGGSDEGAPGLRGPEGDHAFYGAYFRDPDGNKLCVYIVGPA